MPGYRLPAPAGQCIDRQQRVGFTFNGRAYQGYAGDTLAAALLANGVHRVARSFKLHRPRGVWGCGLEEPCALVDVGSGPRRTPNVRATLLPISEGLSVRSVNCWPGPEFDVGAVSGWLAPLLPAGFYYKTFMWPSWRAFEPTIRRMAGFGRIGTEPDPDHYEEIALQPDVLVVGAGIAGLAAAAAAARAGARTVLLGASARLGGQCAWQEDAEAAGLAAAVRAAGVRILTRTTAFGVYDHALVCAHETVTADGAAQLPACVLRERLWKIRARAVIAATGAFERPVLFADNDRPGVMLASAALKFAGAYGVACGRRAVMIANSDAAYAQAARLRAHGIEVAALVDVRPGPHPPTEVPRLLGEVHAVHGARAVAGVSVRTGAGLRHLACDLLLSSGGFAPAVHLHSQAGGRLRFLEESAMFVPDGPAPSLVSVGACAGMFGREAVLAHARAVGEALARECPAPAAAPDGCGRSAPLRPVAGKAFVDLQNDVTSADVALAARENYRSVEHLKRYTTTGMGTDQGKTSNLNALLLMAQLTGQPAAAVGTTRFRPPFAPVSFGALAGRRVGALYRPLRRLPAHAWHESHGAQFEIFGDWVRPVAYPQAGEDLNAAAQREALAVRRQAGLFDGSPLGKLEVYGPDAAEFLDLMYVGTLSNLGIGQARYGLLLNENGTLVDDGIVARLSARRFWVNTTTAGVERTAAAFEEWLQCEYPHLRVLITPVTARWANLTVAGPRAWDWLAAAGLDGALAPGRTRHMSLTDSALDGVPLRVLRASFSGELGYEINLPAERAAWLFERVWAHAAAVRGSLYGIEALQILRTEKGYLHIGTDTDGTTQPQDVGFARGVARKAADFVGRRSLLRPAAQDPERLQLVGLLGVDPTQVLPVGAHIAPGPAPAVSEGHVTSSYRSPELGRGVALALLKAGTRRSGERLTAYHLGRAFAAEVVMPPFIDPTGARLHG
ncbi:MAG: (2Fe-2S)-binding protein [Gammaproteobacteria bacterium]|nr:(2Fe-2S)-binding protein [Gammaproteobacteria bacterium]MBV9620016.1 (2Fe-2S)-binding protein [Gammaproteobacteria bacterium]